MPEQVTDGPLCGHLAVEWHDDRPVRVPIVNFNFDSIDPLEDQVREALRQGRLKMFLDGYVAYQTEEVRRDAIDALVSQVINAEKPVLKLICFAYAAGAMAALKRTMEQWGKHFGVTKQDIQQGVDDVRESFKLRQNRTMRNEEARETMRQANFRPKEQVGI
jgi:hypothetical protein